MRRLPSILIIVALALSLLAGCRAAPEILPAGVPGGPAVDLPAPAEDGTDDSECQFAEFGAAGEILSIKESDAEGVLGTIEVKATRDTGQMYDYAMVTITPDTAIYAETDMSFGDLTVGMDVTVFFDGAVAESYPVQGTARQVGVANGEPIEE